MVVHSFVGTLSARTLSPKFRRMLFKNIRKEEKSQNIHTFLLRLKVKMFPTHVLGPLAFAIVLNVKSDDYHFN